MSLKRRRAESSFSSQSASPKEAKLLPIQATAEGGRPWGREGKSSDITGKTPPSLAPHHYEHEHEYELSDEIWLHIIHFCYSDRLGSYAFDDLFRHLPYVSKYFRNICIRYAQCVPLTMNVFTCDGESDFARIAWACRHKVKIGSFHVRHHDCNALWVRAVQHMFQTCNVSDLTSIDLSLLEDVSPYHIHMNMHMKSIISKLRIPGLTKRDIKRVARRRIGHVDYVHSALANVFARDHCGGDHNRLTQAQTSLKKLSIVLDKRLWPHPLLEVFSLSLEELTLHITCHGLQDPFPSQVTVETERRIPDMNVDVDVDMDMDMEALTRTIEGMPNLKELTLHAQFASNFKIRSKSLEILNISHIDPSFGFRITECICPRLKQRIG